MPASCPDLSHHLSREGRERLPNPMKHIWTRIAKRPGMITLANGEPHPQLFPVSRLDVHVPQVADASVVASVLDGTAPGQILTSRKYSPDSAIDLSVALQYSSGLGCADTIRHLQELNKVLHAPHHNEVVLTLGNADGVTKCFRLLGDRGDTFLIEAFSFPGKFPARLINAPLAQGIRWAPLELDAQGIMPEEMDRVLSTWDEATQGRRPHVLYTIPVGQNPTGSSLTLERRKKIYELAQKYDVIILEDDPYYFLQYTFGAPAKANGSDAFLKSLSPTFASMDVDGRVIRIDTFSKTLVPGIRMGWITCNAMFAEKLLHLTDSTTQGTNGFSQAVVCELLTEKRGWGIQGFLTWTESLRNEYQRRRNHFMQLLELHVLSTGYAKTYLPESGMFFWIEVLIDKHPRYESAPVANGASTNGTAGQTRDNTLELMDECAEFVFDSGLAVMPAATFAILPSYRRLSADTSMQGLNHFRATFAGTDDTMEKALKILGAALTAFFQKA
ncbi:L-tyrosine:2-oxoglutarate aminotransferase [Auricularia subglabra TFB-10046 SS5]|nr:L-tyrosine:2-oxoglutarate aminotransferase [Auricularia subglabra TFB-10046 SS5]